MAMGRVAIMTGRKSRFARSQMLQDKHLRQQRRTALLCLLGMLLVTAAGTQALAGQSTTVQIPSTEINQRVISSLPTWHKKRADIIDHLDLTRAFASRTQWTFVVATLPGSRENAIGETVNSGGLAVCFVDKLTPHCKYTMLGKSPSLSWFSAPVHFYRARVVFAAANHAHPLLLVKTGSAYGADGGHSIYTHVYRYDRQENQFKSIFSNSVGSNNNQETRLVEHGPLRGDIIVAKPTMSAPYAYWISVYTWNTKSPYSHLALRYRSATRYGDRNPLSVVDSEMPNILAHFGKWRRGDPLPVPPRLPSGCTRHLFLRGGEEWCRQEPVPLNYTPTYP